MGGVWLMHESAAQSYYPLVKSILEGSSSPLHSREAKSYQYLPKLATADGELFDIEEEEIPEPEKAKRVAIIPLKSSIIKEDDCGIPGTETLSVWLKEAYSNNDIAAVLLDIDSPGGSVDAMEVLTSVMAERNKPIIGFVNGMCASGAMWIASYCDEIHSPHSLSEIGSIGVYQTVQDIYAYFEKQGIPTESIYARQSKEKNGGFRAWQKGDSKKIEDEVTEIADHFIDLVSQNRGIAKDSEVFKGGIFKSEKAMSFGLIDGELTFEATVNRCIELSEDFQPKKPQKENTMFGKSKKEKFAALSELASTADGERTEEMRAAANKELQEAGLEGAVLASKADLDSAKFNASQLENQLNVLKSDLGKEKEAAQAANATLEAVSTALGESLEEGGDVAEAVSALAEERATLTARVAELEAMAHPGKGAAHKEGGDDMGDANEVELTASEKALHEEADKIY